MQPDCSGAMCPQLALTCTGAPSCRDAGTASVWGVSAFAFQGTNAHAQLALSSSSSSPLLASLPQAAPWQKERHWVGPAPHALVDRVAAVAAAGGQAVLRIEVDLAQPKQAYLRDHAVADRSILPGAAFLECASASAHLAAPEAGLQVLLTTVSIPAPLALGPAGGATRLLLHCQLDSAAGQLKLASATPAGVREHMYCTVRAARVAADSSTLLPAAARPHPAPALQAMQPRLAGQPAAVAGVQGARQDGRVDGRGTNPACLDAVFHLGALPAALNPPASGEASAPLRVPAAIAAYRAPSSSASLPKLAGGCQLVRKGQRSVTNTYWLACANSSDSSLCSVEGLEARALPRGAAVPAAASAAAAPGSRPASKAAEQLLYESVWAADVRAVHQQQARQPAAGIRQIVIPAGQPAVLAAAGGIAALQQREAASGALLLTAGLHEAVAGPARPAAVLAAAAAAVLHGAFKAAALEHASGRYSLRDADLQAHGSSSASAVVLGAEMSSGDLHGVALRGGAELRPLLLPLAQPAPASGAQAWRRALAALPARPAAISGGTGTLGVLVALFLASSGRTEQLTLLGRSGRLGGAAAAAAVLAASVSSAAAVVLSSCDTACAEDVAAVLGAGATGRRLGTLVHSGGVLADGTLPSITPASLRRVFAPKVDSLWQLQAAVRHQPAAMQLLFSSVASLLGSPGQASYSSANAALDAAAGTSQQRGLDAAAVQWGAWAGAGMASQDRSTALRVQVRVTEQRCACRLPAGAARTWVVPTLTMHVMYCPCAEDGNGHGAARRGPGSLAAAVHSRSPAQRRGRRRALAVGQAGTAGSAAGALQRPGRPCADS